MKKLIYNHFINIDLKKKIILTILFFALPAAMYGIEEYAIANADCTEKLVPGYVYGFNSRPDFRIRECTTFLGTEIYDIEEEKVLRGYDSMSLWSYNGMWNFVMNAGIFLFWISLMRVIAHPFLQIRDASNLRAEQHRAQAAAQAAAQQQQQEQEERLILKNKAEERESTKDYDSAIQIWEELGERGEAARVLKNKAKERESTKDYDSAIQIWEELGERGETARVLKNKAEERESAKDYGSAIQIWEELGEIDEAARVRDMQAEMGAVKVSQKVVHGDEVSKTEIKDSVLNRSNIGGSSSKMQELEKLTEMKKEGLISEEEYEKMKQEIIG